MKHNFSTYVLPALLGKLREAGHLTAITNVQSTRFKRYLKKPAQMLRDGWRLEADPDSKERVYTLGLAHGMHQEMRVDREKAQVEIKTVASRGQQSQKIVFCMRQKGVVHNFIETKLDDVVSEHVYISIPNSEGLLRRIEKE